MVCIHYFGRPYRESELFLNYVDKDICSRRSLKIGCEVFTMVRSEIGYVWLVRRALAYNYRESVAMSNNYLRNQRWSTGIKELKQELLPQ